MRMSAAKLVGVLAIGGVLLGSTACGPVDSITGGGKKKTACKNIETELKNVASSGGSAGGSEATAQTFSDAAAKIRTEGQNAGGDVETAATAFAGDLDDTAATLRKLSSGNLSGGTPNFTQMQQHGEDLGKACGYTGFHIG
ncbi:hypothetical protein F8568_014475 [Actinomadura sp. LD22]|uniref:Small secreted protein n=1 Tax=Actinomadura physcomitrii TaxID=2650748 RepID=A0A6I4M9G5_9ACTN|nr:hypothetical protein [Actinomadura physcomitrii]MWA01560.1 hypothetical protein [Actinomadura physcomitrii]